MKIGNREFDTEKGAYIMGILNVTPDSFSDGGKYNTLDSALKQTERMVCEGADIIDIGGESTRPGYQQNLAEEEEMNRVLPVIEAVKARFEIPVSLDTYHSAVAEAGIAAGADLINDIWGLKFDAKMAKVIAQTGVPCCLMHNRNHTQYVDFLKEFCEDIEEMLNLAKEAGIAGEKIMLDPGIGFGKTYEQNLYTLKHLDVLCRFGYPVLLGTSRKSVIGQTLDVPPQERVIGTTVTTVLGLQQHCSFFRVHDVRENVEAMKMAQAIWQAEE